MKKVVFKVFFLLFFSFIFVSSDVIAAKLLPRFRSGGKGPSASLRVNPSGVGVSAKLRADRKAIILSLSNLTKARSVTYTLIYKTIGKDEGVSGSIDSSSGKNARRELLFGTCSAGVCKYHTNISSMSLEVVTELLSGKKTLKRFRIRV